MNQTNGFTLSTQKKMLLCTMATEPRSKTALLNLNSEKLTNIASFKQFIFNLNDIL